MRVEVAGDGADVLVDGPLVVVEHDDEAAWSCPAMLLSASKVGPQVKAASPATQTTCSSSPARSRAAAMPRAAESGGAGVARAVAVVLALGAEEEAVEALVRADGVDAVRAAGEHLVDVALVGDVEDELVLGRVEKTRCSAMVSSTTPRFGPRWPPVLRKRGRSASGGLRRRA